MPHPHDPGRRDEETSALIDLRVLSQMAESPPPRGSASASSLALPRFAATDLTGLATLRPTPPPPPPPRPRSVLAPVHEPRGPLYALLASLTVAVAALATYVIVRPAPAVVVQAPARAAAPSVLAADHRADRLPAVGAAAGDGDDDEPTDDEQALDAMVPGTEEVEPDDASPTRDRPRRRDRSPRPTTTTPKPTPKPTPRSEGPSLECQLGIGECIGAAKPRKPTREGKPDKADPSRPAKLTQAQVRTGISGPKKSAKQCGRPHGAAPGERVEVKLSISGATGKVTSATPRGTHAKSALGRCVAQALSKSTFPKFGDPAMGVSFGVRM